MLNDPLVARLRFAWPNRETLQYGELILPVSLLSAPAGGAAHEAQDRLRALDRAAVALRGARETQSKCGALVSAFFFNSPLLQQSKAFLI